MPLGPYLAQKVMRTGAERHAAALAGERQGARDRRLRVGDRLGRQPGLGALAASRRRRARSRRPGARAPPSRPGASSVQTASSSAGASAATIPSTSLPSRTARQATTGRPAGDLGQRLGERPRAVGVVRGVEDQRRIAVDDLEAARELDRGGDPARRRRVEAARARLGGGERDGEVAALIGPARPQLEPRAGARSDERRRGARPPTRSASASTSARQLADDERRVVAQHRELLGRDLLERLAEPLGVLEPDRRQRADTATGSRWWRRAGRRARPRSRRPRRHSRRSATNAAAVTASNWVTGSSFVERPVHRLDGLGDALESRRRTRPRRSPRPRSGSRSVQRSTCGER